MASGPYRGGEVSKIVKFTCHECGSTIEVDMVPEPLALEVVEVTDEGVWARPTGEAVE